MLAALLPLAVLPFALSISLPYIPTTALVNSTNATTIFVFEPNDDATSATLIAIDSSRSLTSNFAATTISSSLPFLSNNSSKAFNPFIDEKGNIYVVAGDCAKGPNDTQLWTLKEGSDVQHGEWKQADLKSGVSNDDSSIGGTNYLAAGYAFSSTRYDTPELYSFGGMCPNSSNSSSDSSTWQASANYSRALLAASPSGSLSSSEFASISSNNDNFDLALVPTRGPPVAEAGFSITALQPSYSGSNKATVQQNLVLIGGHTAQAFINMSQVALLSLPERSWSFLPINNPAPTSAELVRRDSDSLEPRSGHTASLSEDGTKIIVYGGWVGDIGTPAVPQLALLSVGSGYGGNGNWQWEIPSTQGPAPAGGGTYGHAAVVLPGNVMMIIGGNTISNHGSRRKRAASTAAFFNMTSNKWVSDYKNPTASPMNQDDSSDAANSHRGRTVGLGVGLGLGIPLFFVALCLLFCCIRRQQRRGDDGGRSLNRGLSSRGHTIGFDSPDSHYDPGMMAMAERDGDHNTYSWPTGDPHRTAPEAHEGGWRNMRSMEAERTGLLIDVPSPTRGLRRGIQTRYSSYYSDDGHTRTRSGIHVIDETDELEPNDGDIGTALPRAAVGLPATALAITTPVSRHPTGYRLPEIKSSPPVMDPFVDPLGAHPIEFSGDVSPVTSSPNEDEAHEDRGWIEDWEVLNTRIDAQLEEHAKQQRESLTPSPHRLSPDGVSAESSQGRKASPDHSDRTTSTLSDKSMHSAISHTSTTSLRQNPSQRSSRLFSVQPRSQGPPGVVRRSLPAAGTVASAISTLQGTPPSHSRSGIGDHFGRPGSGHALADSPSQKRLPSFGTLQAESQALLGGRSAITPATHLGHTSNIDPEGSDWIDPEEDEEFPKRPNQRRSRGLVGSVRSALSRGRGRASSSSPTNQTVTVSPTSGTFTQSTPSRSGTGTPFSILRNLTSEAEPAGRSGASEIEMIMRTGHGHAGSPRSESWRKRASGARGWDWKTSGAGAVRSLGENDIPGRGLGGPYRSGFSPERGTSGEAERDDVSGEWDVEGASETRQVQVMFTVPRERLRVVNAGESDADSLLARDNSGDTIRKGHLGSGEQDLGEPGPPLEGPNRYSAGGEVAQTKYNPGRGSPGLW